MAWRSLQAAADAPKHSHFATLSPTNRPQTGGRNATGTRPRRKQDEHPRHHHRHGCRPLDLPAAGPHARRRARASPAHHRPSLRNHHQRLRLTHRSRRHRRDHRHRQPHRHPHPPPQRRQRNASDLGVDHHPGSHAGRGPATRRQDLHRSTHRRPHHRRRPRIAHGQELPRRLARLPGRRRGQRQDAGFRALLPRRRTRAAHGRHPNVRRHATPDESQTHRHHPAPHRSARPDSHRRVGNEEMDRQGRRRLHQPRRRRRADRPISELAHRSRPAQVAHRERRPDRRKNHRGQRNRQDRRGRPALHAQVGHRPDLARLPTRRHHIRRDPQRRGQTQPRSRSSWFYAGGPTQDTAAKPNRDIRSVFGTHAVYGTFVAGCDDRTSPTMLGQVRSLGVKKGGTIAGEVWSSAPPKIKGVTPDEALVVHTP